MADVRGATTRPLWLDRLDPPIVPRSGLDGDLDLDVAIVGGGYSGLWTAYYLSRLDPSLRRSFVPAAGRTVDLTVSCDQRAAGPEASAALLERLAALLATPTPPTV